MTVLFLLAEFFALYLVSRVVIRLLVQTIGLPFTCALLFPGTVIHELSHLFAAEILGVRTGKMTLTPEGLGGLGGLEGKEIRAGSVAITKTDLFRRTAIGLAPVVAGFISLTGISYFLASQPYNHTTIFLFYLLFVVSNTMFASKEDLKGVMPFLLTMGIFMGAAYWTGFRVGLPDALLAGWNPVLHTLLRSLGIVLAVNGICLLTLKILLTVTAKLKRMLPAG